MAAFRFVPIILIAVGAWIAGCANQGPETTRREQRSDRLGDELAAIPMTGELSLDSGPDRCEEETAIKALDSDVAARPEGAVELWSKCQAIYACSPTTAAFLKASFESGGRVRIGFADLKSLGLPKLGENAGGVYLAGSANIYMDRSQVRPRHSCALLLHEVVHRFDPVAFAGEESLATEYKAYWYQTALTQELFFREGALGGEVRAGFAAGATERSDVVVGLHTRESLGDAVSKAYGFASEPKIASRFARLPVEIRAMGRESGAAPARR